ncbi:HEAT repeat domain-containing protein [Mariniflexile sp. AS56]|uniref:HEAT repeat domain-containing protein n=1 Tax=Mariniflexile sp. AS56 TaxID=3063957 RepID=UPI0026F0F83E|nr:HEAT repeat domain-containing protein [Mariniflexile sp. AS56]MDO7173262.1 HEAT repeat domain-containing protein [Mariniflexile sp. AS56]
MNKNLKLKRRKALENILLDFINSYLFDEDFDKNEEVFKLKKEHLPTNFHLKIALKQLLIFNENLKGESTAMIKNLFISLGLYDYIVSELKSNAWQRKARALFVLSQLSIEIPEGLIDPLINDKKIEVRQQAILYILNLSEANPLGFLNKIKSPLTLWQQIYIENSLKNAYKGEIPDFSQWLNHDMCSVVAFSIRMMSEFNQFQNIPVLMAFIDHKEEAIRKEAIRSLGKMEHNELLPILISKFHNETQLIKQETLKTIKHIGTYKHLADLGLGIYQENNSVKVTYYNLERYFRSKPSFNIDSIDLILKSPLLTP